MTPFDVGVLVVIIFSAVLGLARRLSGEVLNIFAWVAGIFCALALSDPLARSSVLQSRFFYGIFSNAGIRYATSCVLIFFIAYFTTRFIAARLRPFFDAQDGLISVCDRLLGITYGTARGIVLCSLLYWLIILGMPNPAGWPEWMSMARSRPLLERSQTLLSQTVTRIKQTALVQAVFAGFASHEETHFEEELSPRTKHHTTEEKGTV